MIINEKSDDFVDIVKDDFIKIIYFFALRFDFMRQKVDLTWIGIFTLSFTLYKLIQLMFSQLHV